MFAFEMHFPIHIPEPHSNLNVSDWCNFAKGFGLEGVFVGNVVVVCIESKLGLGQSPLRLRIAGVQAVLCGNTYFAANPFTGLSCIETEPNLYAVPFLDG